MLSIYLAIFAVAVLFAICLTTLHLLCAVQLITKEIIAFKKALQITLAVNFLTFIANFVILLTLGLSGFTASASSSVLTQPTYSSPALLYSVLILPGFLISWYFNSTYITVRENGERDIFKGLSVTVTYFALLTLTTIVLLFSVLISFFK